jgi:hypothetical protein
MSTATVRRPATRRTVPAAPRPAATAAGEAPGAGAASERIRARAYEIYMARTGAGSAGNADSDWLRAEGELRGSRVHVVGSDDLVRPE